MARLVDSIQNMNDRWPNLQELIDSDGTISIGNIEQIGGAALALQGRQVHAQLRIGDKEESLLEILDRLDAAVARALDDGIIIDEINR